MKKSAGYVTVVAGIFLLAGGLYLIKTVSDPQGILLTLPYVCIGIGCGLFGHGMGSILSQRIMQRHPQMQKQMEIEQRDERNIPEYSLSGDLRGSVHEPLRVGQDSRHAILQNTLSADSFIPQLHSAGTEPALL